MAAKRIGQIIVTDGQALVLTSRHDTEDGQTFDALVLTGETRTISFGEPAKPATEEPESKPAK